MSTIQPVPDGGKGASFAVEQKSACGCAERLYLCHPHITYDTQKANTVTSAIFGCGNILSSGKGICC
jgi:hypothetical protein